MRSWLSSVLKTQIGKRASALCSTDWMYIASTMGSGYLGRELNLQSLVSDLEDLGEAVSYKFSGQSMVTIRFAEDGPAYTVYRTGTFQIRGAGSEDELREAEEQFKNSLDRLGVEVSDYEFSHVTSVFVAELDTQVNLEALAISLGLENTEYEPEQFPAIIYRPPDYEVTLLVFSTGKIIVGGTTEREIAKSSISELEEAIEMVSQTR